MKTRHPINNNIIYFNATDTTDQIQNKALKFNRRVDCNI